MQLSGQPDICLTFPRLRNRETTSALIAQHLPKTYHVPITDPQRMPGVLENDPRCKSAVRDGKSILVMIEAPAVSDLQYLWSHLIADIRSNIRANTPGNIMTNIQAAMVIDTNLTSTKRLKADIGVRTDPNGGSDIDPDFYDPLGPTKLIREVRNHMPSMHLIESTDATFEAAISQFLREYATRPGLSVSI